MRHSQWVHVSVAYSLDGKTIATSDSAVGIWDAERGVLKRSLKPKRGDIYTVAFSPDGTLLVGGGRYYVKEGQGTIGLSEAYLWNPQTGELQRTLTELRPWLRAIAFSPDGKTLATGTNGPIWTSPDQHRQWVSSEIRLWDVGTGQLLRTVGGELGDVHSIAFSPDGKTFVYCDGETVTLVDTETGHNKRTLMTKTMWPVGR